MKILLAADGSPYTQAAARYLRDHIRDVPAPREVHVLHVQPPLPYAGQAKAALGSQTVDRLRREEADVALAVAERELEGVDAEVMFGHTGGDIGERIASYVKTHRIDLVVIGSHGLGAVASLALGSVAQECIRRLSVPILVIPRSAAGQVRDGKAARADTA